MPRNKSEQAPKRPSKMSEGAIVRIIKALSVGDVFRVWFHPGSEYEGANGSYSIDDVCLLTPEETAMLANEPLEYKCLSAEYNVLSLDPKATLSSDHAHLFHAIELISHVS